MWLLCSSLTLLALSIGSCEPVAETQDELCPSLQVDEWRFPQAARQNITGFNLVRRFSLLKSQDVKKIRNPKGRVILRLGKTALIRPTDQVFPRGLPDEFTLIFTLALKKTALRDAIYLFQISDQQGYPQLSVELNSPDATLSLRAVGADPTSELVSSEFSGEGVESLLDLRWHKVALSVQAGLATLYVDCSSTETKPLESRGPLSTDGYTLLGVRATDAASAQMEIQQVTIYCDPTLALQEACCEIPGARCPPEASKSRRAAENDLLENTFSEDIFASRDLEQKVVNLGGVAGIKGEKGDRGDDCSGSHSGPCAAGPKGQKGDKGESVSANLLTSYSSTSDAPPSSATPWFDLYSKPPFRACSPHINYATGVCAL